MYKPMAVMTAIPRATIKITTIMKLMMTIKTKRQRKIAKNNTR